jgi:hypothetical protein
MMLLVAFLIQMGVWHAVTRFVLRNEPRPMPHELIEDLQERGYFDSVFGGLWSSRLLSYLASFGFGMLVGHWWIGPACIVMELMLGTMSWFMVVRPRQ